MKKKKPPHGKSIDIGSMFSATRRYMTKPRPLVAGGFAVEVVTITSRQFFALSSDLPPEYELLDPLPPGMGWISPGG